MCTCTSALSMQSGAKLDRQQAGRGAAAGTLLGSHTATQLALGLAALPAPNSQAFFPGQKKVLPTFSICMDVYTCYFLTARAY